MEYLRATTAYVAPLFIVMSPVLSYGDQGLSMHRNKSSAGFSLDIPLIMLVASFFRCAVVAPDRPAQTLTSPLQDRLLPRRAIRHESADTIDAHGGRADSPA